MNQFTFFQTWLPAKEPLVKIRGHARFVAYLRQVQYDFLERKETERVLSPLRQRDKDFSVGFKLVERTNQSSDLRNE